MSKDKVRAAPGPQNRDPAGRFQKGISGNPGGRTQKDPEIKEFCRAESMTGVKRLAEMRDNPETKVNDVIAIVRLFLEYGYGRPAAEYDRERLELDKQKFENDQKAAKGENTINIVLSDEVKELVE